MIHLRPSSAHIWTKCPGQPHLTRSGAERPVETDAAREGTCAAWVAEMVLTGQRSATGDMIGEQHENGWIVDRDMAGFIHDYVTLLRERYGAEPRAEVKLTLTPWLSGTPDGHAVWQHAPGQWTVAVDDLKYGHLIVEPWGNEQVTIYAGMIARNTPLPEGHRFTVIEIGIYQPRAYHPLGPHRVWRPTIEQVTQRLVEIIEAGERVQQDDAPCVAGPQCRYCNVAHLCSAVAHEAYRAVSVMQNADARPMTADEMSNELVFLDLAEKILKGRRDAVKSEAEERISRGELIPGWTLERGKGKRTWTVDAETVKTLTGIDPADDKMVTPLELERRGAHKTIVAALTKTPETRAKLKPFSSHVAAGKFGDVNT